MMLVKLRADLKKVSSPTKAKKSAWFFKTGKGQYGEGDVFIGATVPEQRAIAKKYKSLELEGIKELLLSKIHEERLIALFILVDKYKSSERAERQKIVDFYLHMRKRVNNWDLVDSSAPYILGNYLIKENRAILTNLAKSNNIWDRRIAIVATLALINQGEFDDTLHLCTKLTGDSEDLIHKACGWMLREVGKRDIGTLESYLEQYKDKLPRTTLRYAIERMSVEKRYYYMGKIKKE